jgi:hypothetical protein
MVNRISEFAWILQHRAAYIETTETVYEVKLLIVASKDTKKRYEMLFYISAGQ